MGTTAVVYSEKFNKAVRVNSDGDPGFMSVALARVVTKGLEESFVEAIEFSMLAATDEQVERFIGYSKQYGAENYVTIEGLGVAFKEPIEIGVSTIDGKPHFTQEEDYSYVIAADGSVREI